MKYNLNALKWENEWERAGGKCKYLFWSEKNSRNEGKRIFVFKKERRIFLIEARERKNQ